ncbi:hypothetical protein BDZ91DRAFT_717760 [Kalaharituber pfeilii]|nr:hypothetical protein BDZ91DRAFT_717760 [Kalaharituber pfeilii]
MRTPGRDQSSSFHFPAISILDILCPANPLDRFPQLVYDSNGFSYLISYAFEGCGWLAVIAGVTVLLLVLLGTCNCLTFLRGHQTAGTPYQVSKNTWGRLTGAANTTVSRKKIWWSTSNMEDEFGSAHHIDVELGRQKKDGTEIGNVGMPVSPAKKSPKGKIRARSISMKEMENLGGRLEGVGALGPAPVTSYNCKVQASLTSSEVATRLGMWQSTVNQDNTPRKPQMREKGLRRSSTTANTGDIGLRMLEGEHAIEEGVRGIQRTNTEPIVSANRPPVVTSETQGGLQSQFPASTSSGIPRLRPMQKRALHEVYTRGYEERIQQTAARSPLSTAADFQSGLDDHISKHRLQTFYPPNSPVVATIANEAAAKLHHARSLPISPSPIPGVTHTHDQYFTDISKTALYTTVLFIDDSTSMRDDTQRIPALKSALRRAAEIVNAFDSSVGDGLSVRFLNAPKKGDMLPSGVRLDGLRTMEELEQALGVTRWKGGTRIGRKLEKKVLEPFVFKKVQAEGLERPVLVSIITDGEPEVGYEERTKLRDVIYNCKSVLRESKYGEKAVKFHITQIGNSLEADNFLNELAQDEKVGGMVYCTSEFLDEQVEKFDIVNDLRSPWASKVDAYDFWWSNEWGIALDS